MVQYKQDMPPQGGYAPITYQRVPLKPAMSSWLKVGILSVVTAVGWQFLYRDKYRFNRDQMENRCARLALQPLLIAERDRAQLKFLRKAYEEEKELMKDVPGWKVGTWFGEPVYHTYDEDKWIQPHNTVYYSHNSSFDHNYPLYVWFR